MVRNLGPGPTVSEIGRIAMKKREITVAPGLGGHDHFQMIGLPEPRLASERPARRAGRGGAGGGAGHRQEVVPRDAFDRRRDEKIAESPEFARAWNALEGKRQIVTVLLRLRARANLTQKELAEKAGWPPSFVSRLESFPRDGEKLYMPDIATISRYVEVCGSSLGLVFAEPAGRGAGLHISEAVGLGENSRFRRDIAVLSDSDVNIKDRLVQSVAKSQL